jgi:hypothetical protein
VDGDKTLTVVDGARAGAWIKPRLEGEFGAITLQVPKGFEAYARVLHPASDAEWNPIRWADVAKACGTAVHREMQWHAIVGLSEPKNYRNSRWSGQDPATGSMGIDDLDALCEILTAHTTDPKHVFFGLCTIERWEESFTREKLKKNRLLRLPWGRDHIVLAGHLAAVKQLANDGAANPGPSRVRSKWVARAPSSSDEASESASDSMEVWEGRDAPNLIWPADQTWLVASEVDFDSTLVGGSSKLIKAIVESFRLEAWRVEPTDSLAADADKINVEKQS